MIEFKIGDRAVYNGRPVTIVDVSPGEYGQRVHIEHDDGNSPIIITTPGLDPSWGGVRTDGLPKRFTDELAAALITFEDTMLRLGVDFVVDFNKGEALEALNHRVREIIAMALKGPNQ